MQKTEQTGFEETAIKVPTRLLRLVEDQHYFGRTKDKFWTDCIRRGVCSEMGDLEFDEMKRLERKFKVKRELIVYSDKVTL
jgi:hypothetical protein